MSTATAIQQQRDVNSAQAASDYLGICLSIADGAKPHIKSLNAVLEKLGLEPADFDADVDAIKHARRIRKFLAEHDRDELLAKAAELRDERDSVRAEVRKGKAGASKRFRDCVARLAKADGLYRLAGAEFAALRQLIEKHPRLFDAQGEERKPTPRRKAK